MTVLGGAAPTARGVFARVLPAAVAAALMLVAAGCSGPSAPAGRTAASSKPPVSPHPLTSAEREWIAGLTRLETKLDKPFQPRNLTMTRAKMLQFGRVSGGCGRELGRLGAPSARLERAYTLAQKACRSYTNAARCFARAAHVSDPSGGTVVGTPQARIQRSSLNCGMAGAGNGTNSMGDALAEAREVRMSLS
jgi:hypothetical protein